MGISVADNFDHKSKKPLDARTSYSTLALMKAVIDANINEGCLAYCAETDKYYKFLSTNTVDETLGKWREFSSGGGGGSTYTAGDGIDITNDVISTKQSEEGDIDEIIGSLPSGGMGVTLVNAFNRGDLYSTTEKMIGQWIDGKPVYQLVYKGLTPTTANSWVKIIDFSTMNVDYIVSARAFTTEHHDDTYNYYQEVPYTIDNCYVYVGYDDVDSAKAGVQVMNNRDIYIRVGPPRAGNSDICVIVQYTKTTDSAISIGDETEYSTTEKIVGTWIDGKPIYQKTLTGATPQALLSSRGNIYFYEQEFPTNIDKVVGVNGYLSLYTKDSSDNYTVFSQTRDLTFNDSEDNGCFAMWAIGTAKNRITYTCKMTSQWFAISPTITLQYTKTI